MQTRVHETKGASDEAIIGLRLVPGAIIRPGDVCATATGSWETYPHHQIPLRSTEVIWVRPRGISIEASAALLHLTSRKREKFIHVYESKIIIACHKNYDAVDWNRTPRSGYVTQEVLQELLDYGYLARQSVFGQVYSMTALGHEHAQQLWAKMN